jgi:beta-xylosidase
VSPSRISVVVLVAALTATLLATPALARARRPVGKDPVRPGMRYHGDFPDPSVIRVGRRYYANSTTTDGLNVPTLISTNIRVWRARTATATDPRGDALLRTASWSAGRQRRDGRFVATVWAPSVTRLGPRRYVLAYATVKRGPRRRMCVSLATAPTPAGPFTDRTRRPTVCPAHGAIDPQVYRPRRGRPWLVWKVDRRPASIRTHAMNRRGTRLLRRARTHVLARAAMRWEGRVIENPAMIRFHGRYYLFYSGNGYATARYAVGYLVCRSDHGGCRRTRSRPLLASHGGLAGPGGATPFVDRAGRLRLAYHAWRRGAVGYSRTHACLRRPAGCGQRRLYIATIRPDHRGRLHVVQRR